MDKILKKGEIVNYVVLSHVDGIEHTHDEIELLFVLEGKLILQTLDKEFILQDEDLFILNAHQKHKIIAENSLICIFHISYELLSCMLNKNRLLFWCNSIQDASKIYTEIRYLILKILKNQEANDVFKNSLNYQLLDHIVHNFLLESSDYQNFDKNSKHIDRIERIRDYIMLNYNQDITLSDLANYLGFSVPYMSKYFKKQFGMNFIEYVNALRLNHAVDDLIYTDLPITRIVIENGFANVSIFNKLFKEVYCKTPSKYRADFKGKSKSEKSSQMHHNNPDVVREKLNQYLMQKQMNNDDINIEMNTQKTTTCQQNYNKLINIGYAHDLLSGDVQNQIISAKEAYNFTYARFWGIFASEMEIQTNKKEHKYNFSKVDRILDFLIKCNVIPFIELGPKAKMLHQSLGDDVVYENNYIFDLAELKQLLHAFLVHCVNKYGKKSVKQWYFEFWDHTNIKDTYKITKHDRKDFGKSYIEVFDELSEVMQEVLSDITFGGGGFSTNFTEIDYTKLFNDWSTHRKPSFISFNLYPYEFQSEEGCLTYHKDADFMKHTLLQIKEIMDHSLLAGLPLIISEWNINISNRNLINDTCFKGAYIIKNCLDCLGLCDMFGYWFLSDLLSEYKDTYGILFGGAGLLSRDGLRKPSSHAMSFLKKLGSELIYKDDYFICTKKSDEEYLLICHNYKHFNNYYFQNCEKLLDLKEANRIFEDERERRFHMKFKNLKNGSYRMKTYHISNAYGSVLDEWNKMGMMMDLKNDEFAYLDRVSFPKLTLQHQDVIRHDLNILIQLDPNEFIMMYIYYDYK